MKQLIMVISLIASAGAIAFFFTRSSKRKTHKPMMTFAELYEDNLCSENDLFD